MQNRQVATRVCAVAGAAAVLAGGAVAAQGATVRATGGITAVPGKSLTINYRFSPMHIGVSRGTTVDFVNRHKGEPHTVTIVKRRNVPITAREIESCGICERLSRPHIDPANPEGPPKKLVVNKGRPGLDRQGDSIVLMPGGKAKATVSAPRGRVLSYLCAIHPWMHGSITSG